ncbi:uncharacterized protein J7T54_004692 [Emericellopsis cladophorae]|uniref:Short chain dehydrogenase n=1 Tax=Emericellopsis cladophorae TaxID=2686198 RepID=A0A9Q0BGM7_9HYPO|nr:uncharacterized protein J7T54_004692 [Emericellopsis cladophorae]KAI6784146.1 hypothetical protein J7T54_004692 [Emericellopsis cladophorae]
MSKFYALIAGTGAGTGRATALRFAQAYPVVLFARNPSSYEDIVKEIEHKGGQAVGITTDVADAQSLRRAFQTIDQKLPGSKLAAALYNVNGGFAKKPFLELTAQDFDAAFDGTIKAFVNFSQETLPLLLTSFPDAPHPPTLLITGATASLKGSAQFGAFAAGKFALRGLGQSLAREFAPQGVHVAHAIVDGVIDIPRLDHFTVNNGVEDGKIRPEAIAETYWQLHVQHRSAFTQELDIRPYVEKF